MGVVNAVLIFTLIVVLYPLVYVTASSFSSTRAVTSGSVWLWPVEPSLAGYRAVFQNRGILSGYANSAFYAVFGTIISVVCTVMAAFPLSQKDFYGRRLFMFLFTFTLLFSGGIIPLYLVVRGLGMIDSRLAIIVPTAVAAFQVIIARTFFQSTIPAELSDAAEIDGCSDITFLVRIVLPLSKAIIAVLALMYAVAQWNSYFPALLYLTSREKFPLQIVARNILILNAFDPTSISSMGDVDQMMQLQGLADLLKYSLIVVASLPVLALYPFVQKYFVKGVLIGSLKG
jgi:putative aldouronate transport system permease protein